MTSRGGRLALGIVLSAVTVLLALNGPNVWRTVMTKRTFLYEIEPLEPLLPGTVRSRGYYTVKRWANPSLRSFHGRSEGYYDENGFKKWEAEYKDGDLIRITIWLVDGTVYRQVRNSKLTYPRLHGETLWEGGWPKHAPPWWWGVKDQTEPTAPPWWWGVKDQTELTAPWWNKKNQ